MALRSFGKLIKVSSKAGVVGGTLYVGYESGLWKGTDETIGNLENLKKDADVMCNTYPDVKKWTEYATSSVDSNLKPYKQAVADFRKEWLNFDLSGMTSPINGVIKPAWNKGVAWVAEALADSPDTIKSVGSKGVKMITEATTPEPVKPGSK